MDGRNAALQVYNRHAEGGGIIASGIFNNALGFLNPAAACLPSV